MELSADAPKTLRYDVFSAHEVIRNRMIRHVRFKIGMAFSNVDGSISVCLDATPLHDSGTKSSVLRLCPVSSLGPAEDTEFHKPWDA